MNFNKLNTVLLGIICLLVLSTLLIDISVNISWSASITDWLSVIIYFCTLFAAVTAAVIAKKALDENRKTTKTQTEPFIDIKLEVMPQSISWIRLKITNIGLTSAFDISFNFNELDRDNEKVTRNIIGEFSEISFMRNGLSYLSKGDSRYTTFINLLEGDLERGFSVEEFFKGIFLVKINFKDVSGKSYCNQFKLIMNELEGEYSVGEKVEEKIIKELKNINRNLTSLKSEHERFKNEYEKAHRVWTEEELEMELGYFKKQRKIREFLGQPTEQPLKDKRLKRKVSIHEMRKLNK